MKPLSLKGTPRHRNLHGACARSNTRAEGCEASRLLRPPLILHLPIQCCTAQVHQDCRHQPLCSGSVWYRLPRFPCPVLPSAQSTVHGDTKATQPALLGHTGCSLRNAWVKTKPCLVLGQLGSSSSEPLTQSYLPLEQPVCHLCLGGADMFVGFPWYSVLMPSCTVGTGLGSEVLAGSPPLGLFSDTYLA